MKVLRHRRRPTQQPALWQLSPEDSLGQLQRGSKPCCSERSVGEGSLDCGAEPGDTAGSLKEVNGVLNVEASDQRQKLRVA